MPAKNVQVTIESSMSTEQGSAYQYILQQLCFFETYLLWNDKTRGEQFQASGGSIFVTVTVAVVLDGSYTLDIKAHPLALLQAMDSHGLLSCFAIHCSKKQSETEDFRSKPHQFCAATEVIGKKS